MTIVSLLAEVGNWVYFYHFIMPCFFCGGLGGAFYLLSASSKVNNNNNKQSLSSKIFGLTS